MLVVFSRVLSGVVVMLPVLMRIDLRPREADKLACEAAERCENLCTRGRTLSYYAGLLRM